VEAISEAGVELRCATDGAAGQAPLVLELPALASRPLPLEPRAWRPGRLGATWAWDGAEDERCQALRRFLHGREGAWPERRAPLEPLALAMVLGRLVRGPGPEDWFRRSLIPQAPP
jgi:cellulose synthase (UDP-forming)